LGDTIVRWTTLHHVTYINFIVSIYIACFEYFVEQFACPANKWKSCLILILTGSLTDNHELGLRITPVKNNIFPGGTKGAVLTVFGSLLHLRKTIPERCGGF
jgi:hypothetical protein